MGAAHGPRCIVLRVTDPLLPGDPAELGGYRLLGRLGQGPGHALFVAPMRRLGHVAVGAPDAADRMLAKAARRDDDGVLDDGDAARPSVVRVRRLVHGGSFQRAAPARRQQQQRVLAL